MSGAYYNEIEPHAAQWLRNLIAAGHIADGVVDERSIEDVVPAELSEFTQCHFFAGVGIWSLALRTAGWPDHRPVWTMSCPCQPFSAAGKGIGVDDERHLWPHGHHLIAEQQPANIFGEQVASLDGLAWLDLVQSDLEGAGYTCGALDHCAAGYGSPNIRQRLYFAAERMGDAGREGLSMQRSFSGISRQKVFGGARQASQRTDSLVDGMAHTSSSSGPEHEQEQGRRQDEESGDASISQGNRRLADDERRNVGARLRDNRQGRDRKSKPADNGAVRDVANAHGGNASPKRQQRSREQRQQPTDGRIGGLGYSDGGGEECLTRNNGEASEIPSIERSKLGPTLHERTGGIFELAEDRGSVAVPGPTNGLWTDVDWIFCRDGKWRPVEPGTFPLAHGATSRVGRLRAYGNGLNLAQATAFIAAYISVEQEAA